MPKPVLDADGHYANAGIAWRVCPRLLELDKRHGVRHDQWPETWRRTHSLTTVLSAEMGPQFQPPGNAVWDAAGNLYIPTPNPDHLIDPEGHTTNTFAYASGSSPETPEQWPTCQLCGRKLVWSDGDPV